MSAYKSKYGKLPGTSYEEIAKSARREYHIAQKRTPRRAAYVRSKYFKNDKVFINQFWEHLNQKSKTERQGRLKYFLCALDLIRNTKAAPTSISSNDQPNITLHRFQGLTKNNESFSVQVKENKRTNRKDFMSAFPSRNK